MSRRIVTEPQELSGTLGGRRAPSSKQVTSNEVFADRDGYFGRLMKYIPAEAVGLYLAARNAVPLNEQDGDYILWGFAILAWLFVPIYLYKATTHNGEKALWWQIAIGTIAFPIWVFAVGGKPVMDISWYASHQYMTSVVLVFATTFFALKRP